MDHIAKDPWTISPPTVGALWLMSLAVLLIGIGHPPITRTQEARVLETARQMLGAGMSGWISPTLNGEPRMKKPPLCYWMSAVAYQIGGVSETAGRIPTALLGWITLGVTYDFARRLFDQKVAIYSCAALFGSLFFYRFSRLAETDPAVMCFLTLAIYCFYRSSESRNLVWPHLAATALALVIMSKGAPAIFAGIYLVALCAVERRWEAAKRFIIFGAPLTLTALAAPWFIVAEDASASELRNTITGGDHFAWPTYYLPTFFAATAPWSLLLPLAIYVAATRWTTDPSIRLVIIWLLSIFIPLCLNGNKQTHYIVMLLPPLMMLMGLFLADVPEKLTKLTQLLILLTIIGAAIGGLAGPLITAAVRNRFLTVDLLAAVALCGVAVLLYLKFRMGLETVIPWMLGAVALLMPLLLGFWIPSAEPDSARRAASEIREIVSNRRLVFFGQENSLTLCFYLRRSIPTLMTNEELMSDAHPGLMAVAIGRHGSKPPTLPQPFEYRLTVKHETDALFLYEYPAP